MLTSDLHRHDQRTPRLQGIQCRPHGGGSPVQADSCHPHSHLLGLCRSRPVVPGACLVPPRTSGGSDQRPWTRIHVQLLVQACCPPWGQVNSLHPQTDGQMEHVNQEIEAYLQVFVSHRQDDWADWLPLAEFAYNNKVHVATRWTPFELDVGQHPRLGVEPTRTSTVEAADTFARQLDCAQEEAKATLEWAADDMKQYYDQNCQAVPEYKVGDRVWLSLQNYSSDHPMKKLDHKWAGPFLITKVVSPAAIKLRLSA